MVRMLGSSIYIVLACLLLTASVGEGQTPPAGLSLQGRIIKPDTTPEEGAAVQFNIRILSPGAEACILFEENHTLNMVGTAGIFDIAIGSGTLGGSNPGLTFNQVFTNNPVAITGLTCSVGTTYTPAAGATRKVSVQFNDGSGWVAVSPSYTLKTVPYSNYAYNADMLGGKAASNFLQVNTTAPASASQANIENIFSTTNYPKLTDLLSKYTSGGSSTLTISGAPSAATDATNKQYVDGYVGGQSTAGLGALAAPDTGKVLTWNGTNWVASAPAATGITSLGGLTGAAQTFANGTSGTAPAFNSAGTTHTLNIPMAATAGVTAGLISKAEYDTFNTKQSTSLASGKIWVGNAGNTAAAVSMSGDATMDNAGALTLANSGIAAGTYTKVTVDVKGRATASGFTNLGDLRSTVAGNLFGTANCAANETLSYSAVTDQFNCIAIDSLNASKITAGTLAVARGGTGAATTTQNYVFAGPAGANGAPDFRALVAADLPSLSGSYVDLTTNQTAAGNKTFSGNTSVGGTLGVTGATTLSNNLSVGGNLSVTGTSAVTGIATFGSSIRIANDATACAAGIAGSIRYNGGAIEYCNGTAWTAVGAGGAGTVTSVSGTGTVSVATGTTTPAISVKGTAGDSGQPLLSTGANDAAFGPLNVGSAVTGTLNIANGGTGAATTTQGFVFAGPAGANGAPGFRALASTDLPSLSGSYVDLTTNQTAAGNKTFSGNTSLGGTLAVTGATTLSSTLGVTGNATFDTNSLFVDATNHKVGVGTTSPASKLDVNGGIRLANDATACAAGIAGTIRYNGGNLEYCNGTAWTALAASGAGITSLGGLTGATQTFANGTSGTAPAFSSATTVHTLNIPMASTAGVTAGLISKADYDAFNTKQSTSLASGKIWVGDGSNAAAAVTMSGDATLDNAGALTLANSGVTAGTYTKVTVDVKGRVTGNGVTNISDLKSTVAGNLFGTVNCAANQTLSYSAVTDQFNCIAIDTLDAAKITTGTLAVARGGTGAGTTTQGYVFAGPAGANGAPGFRALASTDLPSLSGSYVDLTSNQTAAGTKTFSGSVVTPNLYGSAAASGNITIESTSHATKGNIYLNPNGGNVTVGTTFAGSALEVSSPNYPVSRYTRSTGVTNTIRTVGTYKHTSSGVVVDGFGPELEFSIEGSGLSETPIATVSASRYGANNSGRLELNTFSGGTSNTRMAILPSGFVGIGTSTPTGPLEIASTTAANATNGGSITLNAQNAGAGNQNGGSINLNTGSATGSGTAGKVNTNGTLVVANSGQNAIVNIAGVSASSDYGSIQVTSAGGAIAAGNPRDLGLQVAGGNIGVGTNSPVTKLDVNGAVRVANDATACSATNAGAIRYNSSNLELCNASSWVTLGVASGSNNTMQSGWPDAIYCNTNTGERTFYLGNWDTGAGNYYNYVEPASMNGGYYVQFYASTGAYKGHDSGVYSNVGSCNTSISSLYTAGRAFNFAKGPAAQWLQSGTSAYYNAGNVGIGTTAPVGALTVKSSVVRDNWNSALEIPTNGASNYPSIFFSGQSTDRYSGIIWTASTSGNTSNQRGAQIYAQPTSATNTDLVFYTNNSVGTGNGNDRMRITGSGTVGIGTSNPGGRSLEVYGISGGNNWTVGVNANNSNNYGLLAYGNTIAVQGYNIANGTVGYLGNGNSAVYGQGTIGVQGVDPSGYRGILGMSTWGFWSDNAGVYSAGGFTASDRRLKENIKDIKDQSLDKVMAMRPVSFTWKKDSTTAKFHKGLDYGFIAQEIEPLIPEMVMEVKGAPSDPNSKAEKSLNDKLGTWKSIEITKVIPFLTGATQTIWKKLEAYMKSNDEKVTKLEERLNKMDREIASLKAENEKLKSPKEKPKSEKPKKSGK